MGGGGGGGGATVGNPQWGPVGKFLSKGYPFQEEQFGNYVQSQPLLNTAQGGALDFYGQLPGQLQQLTTARNQYGSFGQQYGALGNQFSGLGTQFGQLASQSGGIANYLRGLSNNLRATTGQDLSPVGSLQLGINRYLNPILQSGGRSTEGDLQATRDTFANAGLRGTTFTGLGPILDAALNREQYRSQRYGAAEQQLGAAQGIQGQALQQQLGLQSAVEQARGQQGGFLGLQQGTLAARAGILGQQAGLVGQQTGLINQRQGLQTGGLNQLLGVQNAETSNFTGLTAPIINALQGQTQAQIAQAQINAQQQQASSNKSSGITGGIISVVGSAAIAY